MAGALSAKAHLLYMSGDYAGARPLYERALAIREAAQGPNHREIAPLLNDYGLLLLVTGDLTGARRAYERAIRISEQALGPDNIGLAGLLNSLGALLRQMGDYAPARGRSSARWRSGSACSARITRKSPAASSSWAPCSRRRRPGTRRGPSTSGRSAFASAPSVPTI